MNIIDYARELAKHSEDVELAYATLELCSQMEQAVCILRDTEASWKKMIKELEGL
jgi:hypothetical protein